MYVPYKIAGEITHFPEPKLGLLAEFEAIFNRVAIPDFFVK